MEQQIKLVDSLIEVLDDLDALGIQGIQRQRAINSYLGMKARHSDTPLMGSFELTPLCNLDCKMCYVHLTHNQIAKDERLLTVDEWKKIIQQAVDAGMMYATLTGGECLTYPGFKEIYLYLVSLGIQPDVMTNGRLLTDELIDFFKRYPPGMMQITLYGSCDDAYEKVTGHRVFRQVMDGIRRAKEAKLRLTIAITPSRFMQGDVHELLKVLYSLELPYTIGDATLQARPETDRELSNYAIDADVYLEIIKVNSQHYETRPQTAYQKSIPSYFPKNVGELHGLKCAGAHSSFHVNWKGELCPCIAFSSIVNCDVIGKGFSAAFDAVRQIMRNYQPPKECMECDLHEHCFACPGEKHMCEKSNCLDAVICQKLKRRISEGYVNIE